MPEMDGIETMKQLRSLDYSHPIVALTANAVAGQADMFLQSGFDDFMSKPIDIRQLNSILNKLVRDKQPAEVIEAARSQKETGLSASGSSSSSGSSVSNSSNVSNSSSGSGSLLASMSPRLMESFARDTRRVVVMLEELCQDAKWIENEENLTRFMVGVHGIGSSLLNIGETDLVKPADILEKAGKDKNLTVILSSAPMLLKGLNDLLQRIDNASNANDGGNASDGLEAEQGISGVAEENAAHLIEKFQDIKVLCSDYDRKGTLDAIAEITNCSAKTREVLDAINEYVRHSDFEEAEKAAEAYLAELALLEDAQVASSGGEKQTAYYENRKRLLQKGVSGLDIQKGIDRYEGDEEIYLKILRSYEGSVSSLLGTIEVVNEEVLDSYRIKVHGIKGASYDVFAQEIGKKAEELEHAASAGNLDFIHENNPPFLEAAFKFVGNIKEMLLAISAEQSKPKKDKPDSILLAKLRDECGDYSMNGAEKAMAEIERYQYEADDGLVDWLRKNLDMVNFQQIEERLSELNFDY
jgi:CheY-like chemotaxis protein/HPt (histidine-containing phosphotransfer) domain-containing protein